MIDREKLNRVPQIIECRSAFKLKKESVVPSIVFSIGSENEENRNALDVLQSLALLKSGNSELAQNVDFIGRFKIPWYFKAYVENKRVAVSYGVHLARPDGLLKYIVKHTKEPEFLYMSFSFKRQSIRVDALPVWLRMDQWNKDSSWPNYNPSKPAELTLFTDGKVEQRFNIDKNEIAFLRKTNDFIGSWSEKWDWERINNQMSLKSINVSLKGSFEYPQK